MLHGDDDIAPFVASFHILERLGDLLQGIASIDNRLERARLGKFRDDVQSFQIVIRNTMSVRLMMHGRKAPSGVNDCVQREKVVAATVSRIRS